MPIQNHKRLAKTHICSSHIIVSFLVSIAFVFSFSSYSFGATQQVLIFGNSDNAASGVVEYNELTGGDSYTPTEADIISMFPSSGTIDDLRVEMALDPNVAGGTQSFALTVRLDANCDGTGADTTLTCTISETATTCNNSDGFSVNAGECVAMEITPSGTPERSNMWWSTTFTPTTPDETVMASNSSGSLATSGTEYYGMHVGAGPFATSFERATLIPTGGTFKNLYVKLATAPGVGTSRTFAFGTVDCTISGTDTTCNSAADTQAATAGQKYTLTSTVSGTPAASAAQIGIVFDPTTEGEWIIASSNEDDLSATLTEYNHISMAGGGITWTATENGRYQLIQTGSFASDMIIKNMYVELEADPGATGDKFTFRLRANAADASAQLEVDLDGVQTGNASATVTITDDDQMTIRATPTSSPAVGAALISYTGFITPTSEARRRQGQLVGY